MGAIRRMTAWGVALLVTLATTACVGLPDTGPVVPVEDGAPRSPSSASSDGRCLPRRATPPR
jgi:hypothetical protein